MERRQRHHVFLPYIKCNSYRCWGFLLLWFHRELLPLGQQFSPRCWIQYSLLQNYFIWTFRSIWHSWPYIPSWDTLLFPDFSSVLLATSFEPVLLALPHRLKCFMSGRYILDPPFFSNSLLLPGNLIQTHGSEKHIFANESLFVFLVKTPLLSSRLMNSLCTWHRHWAVW